MAFDIFSQPQGPVVPVSLFGDAAAQGTSIGKALGTEIGAAVEGAFQGYQQGQQIQLNQAKIDQIPLARAEAEASLAGQQLTNQVKELQIKDATVDVEKKTQDYQQQKEFLDAFQNATPQEQANLVLSGKYNNLFAQNPKLYTQQLQSLFVTPDNGLSDEQRYNIGKVLKIHSVDDYYKQMAAREIPKLQAAESNLNAEEWAVKAADQLGVTPTEAASRITFVPHGKYDTSASSGLIVDPATGGYKVNPNYSPELSKNSWDVIDRQTGQVIDDTGSITDQNKKVHTSFLASKNIVDGTYARRATKQIVEEKPKSSVSNSGASLDSVTKPEAPTSTASFRAESPFQSLLSANLKLTPEVYREVKAPLDSLEQQLAIYLNDPTTRGNLHALTGYNESIKTIARGVSDAQFKSTPAIRAQYTDKEVQQYNAQLFRNYAASTSLSERINSFGQPSIGSDILKAYEVSTPEDLFFVRQYNTIAAQIDNTVAQITKQHETGAGTPAVKLNSSKSTLQYLSGIKK